jgi:hypothetical protein
MKTMEYLGWAFWALNAVVAAYAVFHWSRLRNANGVWGLMTPAGWIWVWQAAGVGLVPLSGWSPWHLFWWFPLGYIVCVALGKALYASGILRL